jgi:choice-of-anchor B domain-containing protein
MRISPSSITPAGVLSLCALLLSSACSPQVAGTGEAAVGVPQPRDTASSQGRQAALPPTPARAPVPSPTPTAEAGWTPAMPLTGRAIKCENGKIRTFVCQNVELLAYLPKDSIGQSAGYDVWGWHDSTTGREFVLIGGASTAFVEVTDPLNPKYLGVLSPHQGVTRHAAQSVKVYKHYALVGYEGANHGMQIFDLSQLRDVKAPPVVFQETAHYGNFANVHTITLNQATGFAYAAGITGGGETCGSGLHMIDVRIPTKPTFAGCYSELQAGGKLGRPGWVHDAQCVVYHGPDQQYTGREICVNPSAGGISIADVTDKQRPKTISVVTYPNIAYAHQGWFTEDQRYFFLNDEGDEYQLGRTRTIAFDMNDLDDPVVLTEFFHTTKAVDHNLYIRGRYMYQGNNAAGLRIIDIADPKNPKEVGYLSNAGAAWGTYPFFKNDVVAVSMNTGLFLARLQTR